MNPTSIYDITWIDVLRSLILGQLAFVIVLTIVNAALTLHYQKPTPGRFIGFVLVSISFVLALCLVIIGTIRRFGMPPDAYIWTCVVMVATGSLGFCMLIIHSILHSERWKKILSDWLK